ncbi:MAG: 7-carboxy-7-deazaguanine synthase QueE [Methanotrichaceae archaeon]|nr:7-carboxy-7-deazaguanine synthase QueE [Methanotrichaceae archaeon]
MGRPATFIRLAGCNLDCEGCDTQLKSWKEVPCIALLDRIESRRAVITGGEPTQQIEELLELIDLSSEKGIEIHIETNGTNQIPDVSLRKVHCAVVSPKRGSYVDFGFWASKENVHFKFVMGPADWCWPPEILEAQAHLIPHDKFWIMPLGRDPNLPLAREAWDLAIRLGVNYSDRLHIRLMKR